jgi:hypothetical protein
MVWSDQPMMMPRASTMLYRELLQAGSQVENHNGRDSTLPSSCVSTGNHGSMNIAQKDIPSVRELQAEATEQPAACKKDTLSEARNRVFQCIKDSLAAIESLDRDNTREDFSMLQKRDSEDALGDRGIEKTLSTLLSLLGTLSKDMESVEASPRDVCRRLTKGIADALYQAVANNHGEVGQMLSMLMSKAGEILKIFEIKDEEAVSRRDSICHDDLAILKASNTEEFLLPAESIPEVLGISVDRSLLDQKNSRRKKTASTLNSKTAKTKRVRWLSDGVCWDGKLQSQLAQVLCLALRQDYDASKVSLPSRLQKFSNKLKNSGACQGLALMGATLDEVCCTLEGMCQIHRDV